MVLCPLLVVIAVNSGFRLRVWAPGRVLAERDTSRSGARSPGRKRRSADRRTLRSAPDTRLAGRGLDPRGFAALLEGSSRASSWVSPRSVSHSAAPQRRLRKKSEGCGGAMRRGAATGGAAAKRCAKPGRCGKSRDRKECRKTAETVLV